MRSTSFIALATSLVCGLQIGCNRKQSASNTLLNGREAPLNQTAPTGSIVIGLSGSGQLESSGQTRTATVQGCLNVPQGQVIDTGASKIYDTRATFRGTVDGQPFDGTLTQGIFVINGSAQLGEFSSSWQSAPAVLKLSINGGNLQTVDPAHPEQFLTQLLDAVKSPTSSVEFSIDQNSSAQSPARRITGRFTTVQNGCL